MQNIYIDGIDFTTGHDLVVKAEKVAIQEQTLKTMRLSAILSPSVFGKSKIFSDSKDAKTWFTDNEMENAKLLKQALIKLVSEEGLDGEQAAIGNFEQIALDGSIKMTLKDHLGTMLTTI